MVNPTNKNLKHRASGSTKQIHTSLSSLPPRSHVGANYLRKKIGSKFLEKYIVESRIATTVFKYRNAIVPSYINYIFKPSCNRYNTRSQMALYIPLRKINTGQQVVSFLGPKIWTKVSQSTKNAKTAASFTHALKREILNIKQIV